MAKPKKQTIIITIADKQYVHHQVMIVSAHAPTAKLDIKNIILGSPHGNKTIDDDVLRVVKLNRNSQIYTVVTGFNKAKEALEKSEVVIEAKLVSVSYLDRCIVPPKTLSNKELKEKLLSDTFVNSGFKVHVGKQKKFQQQVAV